MHVFHNIEINQALPNHLKGGVVAIGNFDGIHRGHHLILEHAIKISHNSPIIVLSFNPHPRIILQSSSPIFPLTSPSIQEKILENMGFSALIRYKFTLETAHYSAEQFIQKILVEWLEASKVITGTQFRFGKDRSGNGHILEKSGEKYGFNTVLIDELRDNNSQVVSSSNVRSALTQGNIHNATHLLGYHFTVESEVIHGKKIGRTLGFPTANMQLPPEILLKEGIYAIRFRTQDQISYGGVANFGRNPTITPNGSLFLESFIFDFSKEIYGQKCTVSFFDYLRPEIKFKDLKELKKHTAKDEQKTRKILENSHPLSEIDRIICF
ncbi:bifunctional riboflavin kinase/FAD synthetase [Candidatus Liberibacter africanus]|uniref:Riboflavin biosynthesis protein n=1 Tax=Candidatus Liberibacter africanus PTSAPSY TaxID=1277257 RepID=A0A0G3I7U6_LIBAF|nr:bifunctional riboflavin kinase/FAD synthetase [Candidatus Liberibacter africanus]AKK19792.1 bifunctional riboflavin kinase/FMN adenylyltransferase [Candidatus Liberibacter africanus PTSAPSY]